jgi:hypothetical protein
MSDQPIAQIRGMVREMAKRSIVTEATARLLEQVIMEANAYHLERVAALEAALRPFAAISGVGAPRMKIDPTVDRLWSYHDSRADHTHEITRAHVDEAARVLKST